ncbi:MAG: hypothetical protein ABJB12_01585 [Pseudomonadota bacterium]
MEARLGTYGIWLAFTGCVACGSTDYGDAPAVSGSQVQWSVNVVREQQTFLAIVDDTPSGASLRDALESAFDGLNAARDARVNGAAFDPAAWHAVDRSVVIVHPSGVGSARYSSPANSAALRFRDHDETADGHAGWMTAVRAALAQPAQADAPFRALEAFQESVALVFRQRPPTTADERALLAALAGGESRTGFMVSVALATEDQSPGAASQYTSFSPNDLIVPAAAPSASTACLRPLEPPTARYAGWGSPQLWPCDTPQFFEREGVFDSRARCLNRPIAIDATGSAVCLVTATYAGSEPCPAEVGWLDPVGPNSQRTPRVDHGAAGDTRTCEVRQLDGAGLVSCRTALDCADCEPGWCATEVPDLSSDRFCPAGEHSSPLRFVRGADSGPLSASYVTLNIVCEEASVP